MYSGITVSIRYVEFISFRVKGYLGRSVKGFPAVNWCGFAGRTNSHQDLAIRGTFPDRVIAIVHTIEHSIGTHGHAVGTGKQILSP